MKSRKLVGKTIRRVVQNRYEGGSWSLEGIEFTDGTWLRFVVMEGEGDYGVRPIYPARPAVEGEN